MERVEQPLQSCSPWSRLHVAAMFPRGDGPSGAAGEHPLEPPRRHAVRLLLHRHLPSPPRKKRRQPQQRRLQHRLLLLRRCRALDGDGGAAVTEEMLEVLEMDPVAAVAGSGQRRRGWAEQ